MKITLTRQEIEKILLDFTTMMNALIDIVQSSTDQGAIERAISAIAEVTGQKQ
jgi:hypothetical protein